MLETLPTVVGAVLIVGTLRDVVHELFHPDQTGSLSRQVMHGVWRVVRKVAQWRRDAIFRAGPIILLSVMSVWVVLIVGGFALIYWPRLPGHFNPDPALAPSQTRGFWTAVYVSIASFTTISASDLTPKTTGIRLLVGLESFVGPVLFTAWISWVLGIYPVLAERRTFTREVDAMRQARPDPDRAVHDDPIEVIAEMLRSLTERTLSIAAQLQQATVTYYFQNPSKEAALAVQLPYLLTLARAAEGHASAPAVRHHGAMLRVALERLIADMGDQYVDLHEGVPPERVIAALIEDHLLPSPNARGMEATRAHDGEDA